MGGDCLADVAALRAEPELFGPVASEPVISRLIAALAADVPRALKAIRAAPRPRRHDQTSRLTNRQPPKNPAPLTLRRVLPRALGPFTYQPLPGPAAKRPRAISRKAS
jgi:hypothetical protein